MVNTGKIYYHCLKLLIFFWKEDVTNISLCTSHPFPVGRPLSHVILDGWNACHRWPPFHGSHCDVWRQPAKHHQPIPKSKLKLSKTPLLWIAAGGENCNKWVTPWENKQSVFAQVTLVLHDRLAWGGNWMLNV